MGRPLRTMDCLRGRQRRGRLGDKSCQLCKFADTAEGLARPLLVCDVGERLHRIVHPHDGCDRFQWAVAPIVDVGPDSGRRLIPLTKGKYAIVDACDYAELSKYKWHVKQDLHTYYAARMPYGKLILMHREILHPPRHLSVDHADRNGWNNTRVNLRACTHAENMRNQGPRRHGRSIYKGVTVREGRKCYARLTCAGKGYYLGAFDTEEAAARAYDAKAREVFGKFAYLNFPEEGGDT